MPGLDPGTHSLRQDFADGLLGLATAWRPGNDEREIMRYAARMSWFDQRPDDAMMGSFEAYGAGADRDH